MAQHTQWPDGAGSQDLRLPQSQTGLGPGTISAGSRGSVWAQRTRDRRVQGVHGKTIGVMLAAGPGKVCGRIPEKADSKLLRVLPPSPLEAVSRCKSSCHGDQAPLAWA